MTKSKKRHSHRFLPENREGSFGGWSALVEGGPEWLPASRLRLLCLRPNLESVGAVLIRHKQIGHAPVDCV